MARYTNIPNNVQDTFAMALADPDRLSQNAELALVTARIDDLLLALDSNNSIKDLTALVNANSQMKKAWAMGDTVRLQEAMYDVDQIIEGIEKDDSSWKEVIRLIEVRRKLVDNERKYMVQLGQLVPLQDVIHIMQEIANVIVRYVTDDDAKRQILTQMEMLLLPSKASANSLHISDNRLP